MPRTTFVSTDGRERQVVAAVRENVVRTTLSNAVDGIGGECSGRLACATCYCHVDAAWSVLAGDQTSQDERVMLESIACPAKAGNHLSSQIVLTEALDGLVTHLPGSQFSSTLAQGGAHTWELCHGHLSIARPV
jgi:ferredoxin, 2Fe-2S